MFRRGIQFAILSGVIAGPGLLFAQPPGRGGPPGGPAGGPPREMILELFKQADTNKDGSVTKEELTAAMQKHARGGRPEHGDRLRRGNQQGERPRLDGPPPREGGAGELPHGHHGAPPKPGEVLPQPIVESLHLNDKQARQLAELQKEVDRRLALILTDEQQKQLKDAHPPHGRGHEERRAGERPEGRPQRPQRPE